MWITMSQIVGLMARQAGGYARVGFLKKDLYNYIHKQRHSKIVYADLVVAVRYLEGKVNSDPMIFLVTLIQLKVNQGTYFGLMCLVV